MLQGLAIEPATRDPVPVPCIRKATGLRLRSVAAGVVYWGDHLVLLKPGAYPEVLGDGIAISAAQLVRSIRAILAPCPEFAKYEYGTPLCPACEQPCSGLLRRGRQVQLSTSRQLLRHEPIGSLTPS